MELHLKGKAALVTGATRGLGKAICESLAAEGVSVGVNYYRNAEKDVDLVDEANLLVEELKLKFGVDAVALPADVAVESDVIEMFRLAIEKFGKLDILINNAGICPVCYVKDMSEELWTATIETNLTGTFLASREMANHLLGEGRGGRILSVASQAAFNGSATGKAHYAASKGGMVAFTVSLAREMARKGITVNCIAPGMMYTEMVAETLGRNAEKYNREIPLGRVSETSEVADMIAFLVSDKADYMTGATVDFSGGMLMR